MVVKSPTTYEEQISELKSKGFIITDEAECIQHLENIRYYRLLAYLLPFKERSTKAYFPGISINRIYRIYDFDSSLRTLLFGIIEEIEIRLRSVLSYYNAHTYGSLGYLNSDNYNKHHNEEKFISELIASIYNNRNTSIVKWHTKTYEENYPIWVIIEFFTFGMLSRFYADMLSSDKKNIAKIYGTSSENLESWLRCISDLRNSCAHYARLYYSIFPNIPAIPSRVRYTAGRRVFDNILPLKYLYENSNRWNNHFLAQLQQLITEYVPDIKLNHIGFPENWYDILHM